VFIGEPYFLYVKINAAAILRKLQHGIFGCVEISTATQAQKASIFSNPPSSFPTTLTLAFFTEPDLEDIVDIQHSYTASQHLYFYHCHHYQH